MARKLLNASPTYYPDKQWLDKPTVSTGVDNPYRFALGSAHTFHIGVWHTLEFVQTAQSAKGVGDGQFTWWVDGVKVVDVQNEMFVPTGSSYDRLFDGIQVFMIRGAPASILRVNDWIRIGELYISGKQ
jgi:hypothetical protein